MIGRIGYLAALLAFLPVYGGADSYPEGAARASDEKPVSPPPLQYRIEHVREEQLVELGQDCLPIPREEFQQLLAASRARASSPPAAAGPRIDSAEYRARFAGTSLVDGRARMHVASAEVGGAALSLSPFSPAVHEARWDRGADRDPDQDATPTPLGVDAERGLVAVGGRAGDVLDLKWSLRGVRRSARETTFRLQLPACPRNVLDVELPRGLVPIVDRGFVVATGETAEGGIRDDDSETAGWRIQLGGHTDVELTVSPEDDPPLSRRLVLVRQSMNYEFSARGVRLEAGFLLNVHNKPLTHLTLLADDSLEIVSVRRAGRDLPWTVTKIVDAGSDLVRVELPSGILGTDHKVEVMAVTEPRANERWRLPGIVAAEHLWQEGTAKLSVSTPLVLKQIDPRNCRIVRHTGLASPRQGELVELQYFSPDATLDVILDRQGGRLRVASGATVQFDEKSTSARVVADLTTDGGDRFDAVARIPKVWRIQAVQSEPPAVLDDWNVQPSADSAHNQLKMVFNQAVREDRGIRLILSLQRDSPGLDEAFSEEYFRAARFVDAIDQGSVTALNVAPSLRLDSADDFGLRILAVEELTAAERGRVTERPGALVFREGNHADFLKLTLRRDPARFAARIELDTLIEPSRAGAPPTVTQEIAVTCTPESTVVSRVLVQVDGDGPVEWWIAGEESSLLSSRTLSRPEREGIGLSDGNYWDLVPRRPRDVEFTIRGRRSVAWAERLTVPLVSLPMAASQTGLLRLHAGGEMPLSILNRNLKAVPAESSPVSRATTCRAVYRYNPAGEGTVILSAGAAGLSAPRCLIWSAVLDSRCFVDGRVLNELRCRIENTGLKQTAITLPAGAEVVEMRVDESPVSLSGWSPDSGPLSIPLPADARYPTLRVSYSTRSRALGAMGRVVSPYPEFDVPVIQRAWRAWLPPGFAHLGRDGDSPGWAERLFGALRPARSIASAAPWPNSSAESAGGGDRLRIRAADHFLSWIGSCADHDTWGDAIAGYALHAAEADSAEWFRVLVDRRSLSDRGMGAGRTLPPSRSPDARRCGLERLGEANLALLVTEDRVVITAASMPPSSAGELRSIEGGRVALVLPGPLRRRIAAAAPESEEYVEASGWVEHSVVEDTPWRFDGERPHAATDDSGWTCREWELGDASSSVTSDVPLSAHAYYCRVVPAAGGIWMCLLLSAIATWCLAGRSPYSIAATLVVSAWIAMLLPPPWAMFGGAVFVGAAAALAAIALWSRRLARREPAEGAEASSSERSLSRAGAIATLGAVAALLHGAESIGQDAEAEPAERSPRIHRVLFPVDDQNRPAGRYVLVPREFYAELKNRAADDRHQINGPLVHRSIYHANMEWESAGTSLRARDVVAEFEFRTFAPDTPLTLPASPDEVEVGSLRLDGQAVPVEYEGRRRVVVVDVPQTGTHRLEVVYRPVASVEDESAGIDFEVPRASVAELRLANPPDAVGIEYPSVRGAVSRDDRTGAIVVPLGTAARLSLRWPARRRDMASDRGFDVDQLLWLTIRPGSVVANVRWKISAREGRPRNVRLDVDSRLRLMPIRSEQPVTNVAVNTSDGIQTIDLEVKSPEPAELVFDTTFVFTDASGVGNVVIPRLEAQGGRTRRRWLGLTVSPALEYDATKQPDVVVLPVSDFMAEWGPADPQPQRAFRLPVSPNDLRLATRSRQPRTRGAERLRVGVQHDRMRLDYAADLETSDGFVFQLRLNVPPELVVEEVSIVDDAQSRLLRWARVDPALVSVLLNSPLSGTARLRLRGYVAGDSPPNKLPKVWLADLAGRSARIEVFRDVHVDARVAEARGLRPVDDPPVGEFVEPFGRRVAALDLEQAGDWSSVDATLETKTNRPRLDARLATVLHRESDGWVVDLYHDLRVRRGLVDMVRLDVPAELVGPFECPEALECRLQPGPGSSSRRRLVVILREPVADHLALRIRGALTATVRERVGAPEVFPLDAANTPERLLLLPKRLDRQDIAWLPSRWLESAECPADLVESVRAEDYDCYRITRPGARATIKEPVSGVPQVRLADVRLSWNENHDCYGFASFDLDPADLAYCILRLPKEYELLNVRVATLSSSAKALGDNQWRIRLGPDHLPQRIEVSFRGTLRAGSIDGGRPFVLPAPTLVALPVERTLWTVEGPRAAGEGTIVADASQIDGLRLERLRYSTIASFIGLASDIVAQNAHQEISQWYTPWARRLLAVQRRIEARVSAQDESRAEEVDRMIRQQQSIAQRLGTEEIAERVRAEAPLPLDPGGWNGRPWQPGRPVHGTLLGAADRLVVRYDGSTERHWLSRIMAGLVISLVVTSGMSRDRYRKVLDWSSDRPGIVLAVAGAAWWVWGEPSGVGLLILVIGLAWTARDRIRKGSASAADAR